MSLIVQKYGGTSVGTVDRIKAVAKKVAAAHGAGDKIVVAVSAMSGETNRLIGLAREIQEEPNLREMDVLVSTGEQVTIALLCMALNEAGIEARSYTGGQVRILTDNAHGKARIQDIDGHRIQEDLDAGRVVVVAGFQGADEAGNITTLGRGGSDTTAVALAAALMLMNVRYIPMLTVFIPLTPELSLMREDLKKLPLKKCWKWPVRAQRYCRFVQLNLLENTMYHSV